MANFCWTSQSCNIVITLKDLLFMYKSINILIYIIIIYTRWASASTNCICKIITVCTINRRRTPYFVSNQNSDRCLFMYVYTSLYLVLSVCCDFNVERWVWWNLLMAHIIMICVCVCVWIVVKHHFIDNIKWRVGKLYYIGNENDVRKNSQWTTSKLSSYTHHQSYKKCQNCCTNRVYKLVNHRNIMKRAHYFAESFQLTNKNFLFY